MAALWMPIYETIRGHRKVWKLMEALSITKPAAIGHLVLLWTWALTNALDGDLAGFPAKAIAEAAEWKKKPQMFVDALKEAGLIDDDLRLHDWDDYTALLQGKVERSKTQTKERVRKHRENKKAEANSVTSHTMSGDETDFVPQAVTPDVTPCNVTVTECNAPTKPIHNQYQEEYEEEHACARENEHGTVKCFDEYSVLIRPRSPYSDEVLQGFLNDGLEDAMICDVIREANANGGITLNYLRTTLQNCLEQGIRTQAQYGEALRRWRKRGGKKGHSQPAPDEKPPPTYTEEEKNRMKELLRNAGKSAK